MGKLTGYYQRLGINSHGLLGPFQALCYLISVLLGLLVTIPVGVTLRNFHGKCILYAQLVWDNSVVYPWSEPSCDYVLYMTLAVGVMYAAFMFIFTLLVIFPVDNKGHRRFAMVQSHTVRYILESLSPVLMLIDTLIFALMLASALVISTGLAAFCDDLVQSMADRGQPIGSCINSKNINWMELRVEGGMDHGINGASFYGSYSVASIAAWCLVVVWGLLLAADFSVCCRGCVCQKAVEKQKLDKSTMIAARRSRLATPIGTPGGLTPRPYGWVPPQPQQQPPPRPYQPQYQQEYQPQQQMGAYGGYGQQAQVHIPPKY